MATETRTHTHTAYAFSRLGKKFGRLLECGKARVDKERNLVHVFMDRTPTTGYTGYIVLSPIGAPPPNAKPPTPDTIENEDGEEDEG
jgi:hypothetical protein